MILDQKFWFFFGQIDILGSNIHSFDSKLPWIKIPHIRSFFICIKKLKLILIFWEGHKILQNLYRRFDWHYMEKT